MRTRSKFLVGVAILAAASVAVIVANWAPDKPVAALVQQWAPLPSKFVALAGMNVHLREAPARTAAVVEEFLVPR